MPGMEELPDDVRQRLGAYELEVRKAYEQEFNVEDSKLANARGVTREQLADLAADAVLALSEVMRESENDGHRVGAAKYVLDKVLGKDTVLDPDDPMADLIKKMAKETAE